jgi:Na+-transporting NADH:ubiquinone oxidoreductase subunit A
MMRMSDHVVRKGLDVPVQGAATGDIVELELPETVAYDPQELSGLYPRLAKREGDEVQRGTVLFYDKKHPGIVVRSPVAGVVKEIRRGARRVITDVVVERQGEGEETFTSYTAEQLSSMSAEDAIAAAMATGMFPAIRTRPLDRIPDPSVVPQSIFIAATETGPLQPGADVLIGAEDQANLQAAVNLLKCIAPVHLTVPAASNHPALQVSGATTHRFSGPHPSGDVGVQVNLVDPPRGTHRVWVLKAWDAVLMGRALLEGRFPNERVYAAVGVGCTKPRFVRTVLGAPLAHIAGAAKVPSRWIRGSVLTGTAVDEGRWASFGARAVHLLPSEVPRYILGWAMPSLGAWSFHRAFLRGFGGAPSEGVDLRPGTFGGERAIVPIGAYQKVVATPDILPDFLFKSILAGDLEEAITLGLLDITMEEAALCTYICPSKVEFDVILKQGLELYEQEA